MEWRETSWPKASSHALIRVDETDRFMDIIETDSFYSGRARACAVECFQIELAKASIRTRARSLHSASVKIGCALRSL